MLKNILFQTHWLLGISAGIVLGVVGATGALLSFEPELLRWANPGVVSVAPRDEPLLSADALYARVREAQPQQRISALNLSNDHADAARVTFAVPGSRMGKSVYADPYTGALLGPARGEDFFHLIEDIHRRLTAGDNGKAITGASTLCLLVLCLSGLYLRWPRRVWNWRVWLTFDTQLKGRSFLWGLHSVAGTWTLVCLLLAGLTGLFWSYEWYRNGLYALTGAPRPEPREAAPGGAARGPRGEGERKAEAAPAFDLAPAWAAFTAAAPNWSSANLRLPERPNQPLQINYLDRDAPHDRARSRLQIDSTSGEVRRHERYVEQSTGGKFMSSIYPLHVGSFFGLPGRLIMMLASLGLPLFAITGWMLYLDRRRKKRAVRAERRTQGEKPAEGKPWLVGYASQSGHAERLAWQSAGVLQAAGYPVTVEALDRLDGSRLGAFQRALFVVSTFGDGEPPDNARAFARKVMASSAKLEQLRYGLLALGDRHYQNFCGFGQRLEHWLRGHGGQPLFAPVQIDGATAEGLTQWRAHLAELTGTETTAIGAQASWQAWRLIRRAALNPGGSGNPTWLIELDLPADAHWEAGDLAEILPGVAGTGIATLEGTEPIRPYSICSLPAEGRLALLIRETRCAGAGSGASSELGLGAAWLTRDAPLGEAIALRLRSHPSFHLPEDHADRPLILIGNGTGIAGLRPLIEARALVGCKRNWLVFGERSAAHDYYFRSDIEAWHASGVLEHLDLAFSRDQAERIHVQDRLRDAAQRLKDWVEQGALIYVCGSREGMAPGVEAVVVDVLGTEGFQTLIGEGRYRRDVY